MYSLRYGTLPIVHRVGGLADTVIDDVTGFVFEAASADALLAAIKRATRAFARPAKWREMQLKGMSLDFGWPRAAREYLSIYAPLVRTD